jgi:hypothetical protein
MELIQFSSFDTTAVSKEITSIRVARMALSQSSTLTNRAGLKNLNKTISGVSA